MTGEFKVSLNSGYNTEDVQLFSNEHKDNNLTISALSDGHRDNNFTVSLFSVKPNNVFALAKAFLSIAPMTNKKLQKLCYYAKAWYLALYNQNLIPESFEAWVHGADQPDLYQKYRGYGFSDIPQNKDLSGVPEEYISFAKTVYASYGHLTGDELERINHQEDPWIKARGGCKPWESCSNPISEQDMKDYYRKMLN